jgi:hypothetical protein
MSMGSAATPALAMYHHHLPHLECRELIFFTAVLSFATLLLDALHRSAYGYPKC